MRYISWVFGIMLFLLALGFAIKNSEPVTLHYFLGYEWQAPLVVIVLTVFCIGAGAGIAASLGFIFRQRREIARLRRELHNLQTPREMQASERTMNDATFPARRADDGI